MSRILSMNSGSLDSLKVSTRCGCKPNAPQMRWTVVAEMPLGHRAPAPVGRVLRHRLQRPRHHLGDLLVADLAHRGVARRRDRPLSAKRQVPTVLRVRPSFSEIDELPAAAKSTIRARRPVQRLATPNPHLKLQPILSAQLNRNRLVARHLQAHINTPRES